MWSLLCICCCSHEKPHVYIQILSDSFHLYIRQFFVCHSQYLKIAYPHWARLWCLDCRTFTPNPVCHPQQTMIFIQKLLFPLLVGHCESEHDNWQQSLVSFLAMQRRKAFCPECREDKKQGGWKYSIGIQSPGQEKGTERNWDRDLAEQFSAQGVLQPKPWISPEQFSGRSSVVHLRK